MADEENRYGLLESVVTIMESMERNKSDRPYMSLIANNGSNLHDVTCLQNISANAEQTSPESGRISRNRAAIQAPLRLSKSDAKEPNRKRESVQAKALRMGAMSWNEWDEVCEAQVVFHKKPWAKSSTSDGPSVVYLQMTRRGDFGTWVSFCELTDQVG